MGGKDDSAHALEAVARSIDDAIVSADTASRIVFWNPAAERMFGWRADEILGQSLTVLMPERYRRAHLDGIHRFRTTGEARIAGRGPIELMGLHRDGNEFPIELTVGTWTGDGERWFTGVIRDVTDRRRAQQQLAIARSELDSHRDARQQATELHDGVIQSLTLAKYALADGATERAQQALDRAIDQARVIVDGLLGGAPPEPGRLRRKEPG